MNASKIAMVLACLTLFGCGGDTDEDAGPGAMDAGGVDAGEDTDAGDTDAGDGDAGDDMDGGGADGGMSDGGGTDGGTDAGTDAGGVDAGFDAGARDAGFDAGPFTCGTLGAGCSSASDCDPGQMCEGFGSGGRALCVPNNRDCGGFAGAVCPARAPNCLIGGGASAWPCATNAQLMCICATMAGRMAYPALCP